MMAQRKDFDKLKNQLIISFTISLFVMIFFSSYSNIRPTEALSYHVNDGWCNPAQEGFGSHCFGDFYAPLVSLGNASPYEGLVRNYPPFAFAILKPFLVLDSHFPGRASLLVYLLLSVMCILFPVAHLYAKKKIEARDLPFVFMFTLLSGPTVTLIDRGNVLAFTIPFIYLFFYQIKYVNYMSAMKYGVIFCLIKPQLILICIFFIAAKRYKLIFKWLIGCVLGSMLSFLMFPSDLYQNFGRWIKATIDYKNAGAIGVLEPVNVSLKSSIDVLFNIFGQVASQNVLNYLNLILFLVATVSLIVSFNNRDSTYNIFLTILIPILFVGTTYHYYLTLLLIPFWFLVVDNQETNLGKTTQFATLLNRKANLRIRIVFISIFTPIVVPWSILGTFDNRGWENISMHWLIAQLILSGLGLSFFWPRKNVNVE